MSKMRSESPLDYAVFHLSPKRSRCELFISNDGSTEKLASGLLKPFISHLQIAEEQVTSAAQSIKLDIGQQKKAETWFTKGTLERFVRFVSTPEALELVNTLDAEMSQLEGARKIYLQGAGGQVSGGGRSGVTTGDDATKRELLRAIDVRLVAVREDLSTACARAAAAGFNINTVSQLEMFAHKFGAHRLNEACAKFVSLNERRPELTQPWRSGLDDLAIRSSYGSDMSIDDDPPSPPPRQQSATSRPLDPLPITYAKRSTFSRESSVKTEAANMLTEKDESSTPDLIGPIQASQPAKRLSVQDRINMFETKQKENSGGKPVELRRLSSDASSAGVLRRWSGASDMSIELSLEKKDTGSPLCTPSSAVVSQDTEFSNLCSGESDVLIDQVGGMTQSRSDGQESSKDSFRDQGRLTGTQMTGVKNQISSSTQIRPSVSKGDEHLQMTGFKNQFSSSTQIRPSVSTGDEHFETTNQREGSESRGESVQVKFTPRTVMELGVVEDGPGSRIRKAFASRYKGIEGDSSSSQKEITSLRETEVTEKKKSQMFEKVSSTLVPRFEDFGPRKLKLNKQGLTNEPGKKKRDQRDETSSSGNNRAQLSGQVTTEAQEGVYSFSTPPLEQDQRVRQSKGNQELNDELKMKASELEQLFAEHKLRVPGDKSNSARQGRSGDTRRDPLSSLHYTKQVADVAPQLSDNFLKNTTDINASSPMTAIDSQYDGDTMITKFSDLSVSESSRGKSYDRYMQKRDMKLREDWSTNREEKEAKSKSLWDSLERNRSEMVAKLTGSEDREDAVSSAHERAARLRSYSSRSIMIREQQHLDFGDSEDDEEALDFPQQNHPHENIGAQGKKNLPSNKSFSSTRTSAAPIPRSATKNSTISSGKRRMLLENPLAQSVPNFSDMKKEITKPSSGANKITRLQVRSYTCSKSTTDEAAIVREDKSRRSQFLRKSSANPSELGEMSSVDTDVVGFTPVKLYDEVTKNAVTKPFLKKGSRTSVIARTANPREKASGVSEILNSKENCDVESGLDEFVSVVKDDDKEEFESLNSFNTEGQSVLDNGEPKHVLEPEKFVNSGSENGDGSLTFSLVDQALDSKLPIPSSFHPVESMPDWSGESPVSWNSHSQHPFSYPHEMSDADAFVESPVGSPASWISHSLNQTENDSARMRKKWGAAQKPMLAAVHSSNNQSHKDMTRGFKRLLKFGRKSRGSESLVDWISATTSEGDDDTDDGRDPANRSSDDLRKSRMGLSHVQASEDGFNETEFFNESVQSSWNSIPAPPSNFKLREDHMSGSSIKAPRSFFSLTFRSKGSDSKLR